jgi:hypothetical protein
VLENRFDLPASHHTACLALQRLGETALRSHTNAAYDANASPGRFPAHRTPRWVKVFGVLALIALAIFAALHLAGGVTGHLSHDAMDAEALPPEHHRHLP